MPSRSALTVLSGLVGIGAAVLIINSGFFPWPVAVLIGGLVAWRWLVAAGRSVRSALASVRGELEVTVSKRQLPVGGSLRVHCWQKFRRPAEVNQTVAELVLRETVRQGSGDGVKISKHNEVVQRLVRPGRRYQRGEIVSEEFELAVPLHGMHTFAPSADNRIQWYVVLSVELARWPDLRREYEVTVLPRLVGES